MDIKHLFIGKARLAGDELESARCLPEIVPLKRPMDTGKVLKYAVVVAGIKRSADQARPQQSAT